MRDSDGVTVGPSLSRREALISAGLAASFIAAQALLPADSASAVGNEVDWPFSPSTFTDRYGPRPPLPYHNGIDFAVPAGRPIYACHPGTVFRSSGGDLGNYVRVTYGNIATGYAHMIDGSFAVQNGQSVQKGQLLGRVGETGLAFGAHLHWETWVNGSRIDPEIFMQTYGTGQIIGEYVTPPEPPIPDLRFEDTLRVVSDMTGQHWLLGPEFISILDAAAAARYALVYNPDGAVVGAGDLWKWNTHLDALAIGRDWPGLASANGGWWSRNREILNRLPA